MSLSKNAVLLLKERYCRNGESPLQVFSRVANVVSCRDKRLEKKLNFAMRNGIFLPASPTLRNAVPSTKPETMFLHPCHVLPIKDSIWSIMNCLARCANIFHYGGGVGFNISQLRPKGAVVRNGGISSGPVSFLSLFDHLTEVVKQGGFRRGALMCVLNYDHPEILSFVTSKLTGKLKNFNISVIVTDEFMEKVKTDERIDLKFKDTIYNTIRARDLFDLIAYSAYISGDPGVLFFDRINKDNKHYPLVRINATNPCGEVPLPNNSSCNLGALNLSKFVTKSGNFDMKKFQTYLVIGMKSLKNINRLGWFPTPEMRKNMLQLDPCGLGFMGLADALIMLGIKYDSTETLSFLDEISKPYVKITDEIGGKSFYKRSQQPTGSLSIIANCSPGIEPIFERGFNRRLTIGTIYENKDLYNSKYCTTAYEIDPGWHLAIQAKVQSFVDAGVSKTINLPNSSSVDVIKSIYYLAWEKSCKGVTIFRDGCKEGVIQRCADDKCSL